MTKFLDKSFSTYAPGDESYRDNWERIFGGKVSETCIECGQTGLPTVNVRGNHTCEDVRGCEGRRMKEPEPPKEPEPCYNCRCAEPCVCPPPDDDEVTTESELDTCDKFMSCGCGWYTNGGCICSSR